MDDRLHLLPFLAKAKLHRERDVKFIRPWGVSIPKKGSNRVTVLSRLMCFGISLRGSVCRFDNPSVISPLRLCICNIISESSIQFYSNTCRLVCSSRGSIPREAPPELAGCIVSRYRPFHFACRRIGDARIGQHLI